MDEFLVTTEGLRKIIEAAKKKLNEDIGKEDRSRDDVETTAKINTFVNTLETLLDFVERT